MKPLIQLKQITAVFVVTLSLACFALPPWAQAVVPAPDGGYPGGNTAEGQAALLALSSGTFNTGVGFFSLLNNTTASFNTALGAGTLAFVTSRAAKHRNWRRSASEQHRRRIKHGEWSVCPALQYYRHRNVAVGASALSANI